MENFGINSIGNNLFSGVGYNLVLKGTRQCSGFKGCQGLGAENDPISVEEWNIDSLQTLVGDAVGVAEYAISLISGRSVILEQSNLDDIGVFIKNFENSRNMVLRIWRATDFNSINKNLHISINQFNKIQAVVNPKKKTIPPEYVFHRVVPVLMYDSLNNIKNKKGVIHSLDHTLQVMGDIPSKNILTKVFNKVKKYLDNPTLIKDNKIHKWSLYCNATLSKMKSMEDEFDKIKNHFLGKVDISSPISRSYSPNWPIERIAAYFAAQMESYLKSHSQDMATAVVADIMNYGVKKAFDNLYMAIARNSNFYHRQKIKSKNDYKGLDHEAVQVLDRHRRNMVTSQMIQNTCDVLDYMDNDPMVQKTAFTKNIMIAIRDRFDGHHGIRERVDSTRKAIMTRVDEYKYRKPNTYPNLLEVIGNA